MERRQLFKAMSLHNNDVPPNLEQLVILNLRKVPWNWIALSKNSFVKSPGWIRHNTGRLANETWTSNSIVSSKNSTEM